MEGEYVVWPGDEYGCGDSDETLWSNPEASVFENARGVQKLLLAEYLRDASMLDTHLGTLPREVDAVVLAVFIAKMDAYEPGIVKKIQEFAVFSDPFLVVLKWRTDQKAAYHDSSPQNLLGLRLRQECPTFKSLLKYMDEHSIRMFKQGADAAVSTAEKQRCNRFINTHTYPVGHWQFTEGKTVTSMRHPFYSGRNLFQGDTKIKKIIPNGLEGICPVGIGLKGTDGPPWGGQKTIGPDSAMKQHWLPEHVLSIGDAYTRRAPLLPPGTTSDVYKCAASVAVFLEDVGPIPQRSYEDDSCSELEDIPLGESLVVFKHGPIPTGRLLRMPIVCTIRTNHTCRFEATQDINVRARVDRLCHCGMPMGCRRRVWRGRLCR